jgi:hypothetical protein
MAEEKEVSGKGGRGLAGRSPPENFTVPSIVPFCPSFTYSITRLIYIANSATSPRSLPGSCIPSR